MLTAADLIFFTGLTIVITGIIGMSSTTTLYNVRTKEWFALSVYFGWAVIVGTISYKAVGW